MPVLMEICSHAAGTVPDQELCASASIWDATILGSFFGNTLKAKHTKETLLQGAVQHDLKFGGG